MFDKVLKITKEELNNLKITGVQEADIINTLRDTFGLSENLCYEIIVQIATFCGQQGQIRRTDRNMPRTLTIMPRKVLYMSST